jgi:hypothetical protein
VKRLLMVAVVLSVAVPAHAGRAGSMALWCSAKGADLITTEMALRNGAYESNPLMRNQTVRIGSGVGICLAAGEVDHRLAKHKKLRWVIRGLGIGLMGYAAARNAGNAK